MFLWWSAERGHLRGRNVQRRQHRPWLLQIHSPALSSCPPRYRWGKDYACHAVDVIVWTPTSAAYVGGQADQKLEVINSHFHADHIIANFGLAATLSLEEVVSTPVSRERPEDLVLCYCFWLHFFTYHHMSLSQTCYGCGGVAVYCDPRCFPKTIAVSLWLAVAISCHPKVTHLIKLWRENLLMSTCLHEWSLVKILQGTCVWRSICPTWYDGESNERTVYCRKFFVTFYLLK